jgi:hypothetical protein
MQNLTYTELPADVAEYLAVNAGVVLKEFDPTNPKTGAALKADILYATTGGINFSCVPEFSDWAEDIDNAPKNTKEFKHLDGWTATMSGTALTYNVDNIKSMLGAADSEAVTGSEGLTKVAPRMTLQSTDFKDLWYVTDWNGGFIAMKLIDALSDGGFTHQSTDNGKGQASFSYTGHKTAADLDRPPMEFYIQEGAEGATGATGETGA